MGSSACVLRALMAFCAFLGGTTAIIGPVFMASVLNSSMATTVSVNLVGWGNTVNQKEMSVKAIHVRTAVSVWTIIMDTPVNAKPVTEV